MRDYTLQTFVEPGQVVDVECPFSEVCMHMRVAGTVMKAEVLPANPRMAQLYRPDGGLFSAPITYGEAGFYRDDPTGRYYYYPPSST